MDFCGIAVNALDKSFVMPPENPQRAAERSFIMKAAVDTAAVKSDLMGKKAAKIITDNAVAVAPTEEKKDDADTSEKE